MSRQVAEAMAYLTSLGEHRRHFGLERIQRLLAQLGHPEQSLKIVHVGGTNGKGSTVTLIASALQAAGFRVGRYTSPHLVSLCERIQVGEVEITPVRLARHVLEIQALSRGFEIDDKPTFFEVVTACAFRHFAEVGVEWAVLEVGLGGRLDATNVIDPQVAVLTSLSLDHTAWLGERLVDIAREKAGIVKPGRPVVSGWGDPGARDVLRQRAMRCGSPLFQVGLDFHVEVQRAARMLSQGSCRYSGPAWHLDGVPLPLWGPHQVENCGLALAALEQLALGGLALPEAAVREGFARAQWPGRLERVAEAPTVLLDGAHNPGAVQALVEAVHELKCPGPRVLLLAVSSDKPLPELLPALARMAPILVATSFGGPRGRSAESLGTAAADWFNEIHVVTPPEDALSTARDLAGSEGLVIAAGSLFLVGRLKACCFGQGSQSFRFD